MKNRPLNSRGPAGNFFIWRVKRENCDFFSNEKLKIVSSKNHISLNPFATKYLNVCIPEIKGKTRMYQKYYTLLGVTAKVLVDLALQAGC